MRLTQFIVENHDAIISDWVDYASTLLPWAEGRSTKSLRNQAEQLLSSIVRDMESPQTSAQKSDKSKGLTRGGALAEIGHSHAAQRLETGFELDQLVSEYRALRASVLRRWAETGHDGEATEITRFNEAIDESLTEATLEYSAMLERTRDQFTGILGHDLRNPLGTIVVGATLLTTDASQDWETRVARRILGAANRMTRMVADLLDLTRTQLGTGLPVTLRPMDVGPVCDQVIAELESKHPGRKVHCEHKGVLLGEWDADRLYQAITNLVVNALDHGSRTGAVAVIAREQGEELVLSVHNEGEPIPAAMLEQIFEPMVAKDPEGLGLGLFIARQVAIAHGGTLTVASTKKNGTTFTVTLPRRPPTKTVPRRADSRPPPSPGALPSPAPEAKLATQAEPGFTLPTRARKARPRPHKGETPGRSA